MNDAANADPEIDARLAAMVARFESIGAQQMRELPIYNPKLAVEAVGFRRHGDELLGALITPWFINIMLLPRQRTEVDWRRVGRAVTVALPSGPSKFVWGGDEVIGLYRAQSVQSPVLDIPAQGAARQKARLALAKAMEPPAAERKVAAAPEAQTGPSRRDLLRGRPGPGA